MSHFPLLFSKVREIVDESEKKKWHWYRGCGGAFGEAGIYFKRRQITFSKEYKPIDACSMIFTTLKFVYSYQSNVRLYGNSVQNYAVCL